MVTLSFSSNPAETLALHRNIDRIDSIVRSKHSTFFWGISAGLYLNQIRPVWVFPWPSVYSYIQWYINQGCNVNLSPFDVSPNKKSGMIRSLNDASLGQCFSWKVRCVPLRSHPWPIYTRTWTKVPDARARRRSRKASPTGRLIKGCIVQGMKNPRRNVQGHIVRGYIVPSPFRDGGGGAGTERVDKNPPDKDG